MDSAKLPHGFRGARHRPNASLLSNVCRSTWTPLLIPNFSTGVCVKNSPKIFEVKSRILLKGSFSVSATKRVTSQRNRKSSKTIIHISRCINSTEAVSAAAADTTPRCTNQSGLKIEGLKLPTSTTLALPRSGSTFTWSYPQHRHSAPAKEACQTFCSVSRLYARLALDWHGSSSTRCHPVCSGCVPPAGES
jgi:hypothetical protein